MKKKSRFKISWPSFSIGATAPLKAVEKHIAERGGGWDGLELGKWYKVFVAFVPGPGELTHDGKPVRPICRVKNKDGNFTGRYIVLDVDQPVKLGQELRVLVTAVETKVVFATTENYD